jgi:hypothetical protein
MLRAMVTYLDDTRKEGHYLFFKTTAPGVAKDAVEGFRAAGMDGYADLLAKALDKANGQELEEVDFEEEDVQLIELGEKQDPYESFRLFICNNRKAFYYDELVNKPE